MTGSSPSRPGLSLCMIVRDSARTIGPCLASIRPWVDEMIVVDTGSLDDTPALCERLGARVYSFPWIDDFSAARNESLKYASGRWIFWMDSDDAILPECGQKLRELALGSHPANVLGYVMQVHCPACGECDEGDLTVVDHIKLFRNLPELRFEGRIHEQIIRPIRRLGGEIGWTDLFVVHSGCDGSPQAKQQKYERDLRILWLDLADRPDHPFVLFNLGMTYNDMGQHEEAVLWLRRSLSASAPAESHVRKVYALLVASLTQLGRLDEALAVSREGRLLFPQDPELQFREGILAHSQGRLADAVAAYRAALRNDDQPHFSSVDPGVFGYKARHNLALVYQDLGRDDLAEVQWRRAVQERPRFKPSLVPMARSLMAQGKLATAALEVQRLAGRPNLDAEAGLLAAELAEREGNSLQAGQRLEELAARYSARHDVLEARCRFLFHRASAGEAESALRIMVERFPGDVCAWHNLASIYLIQQRTSEAVGALRQSLVVRPHAQATRQRLAELLAQEDAHGR